ncbi:MAG: capsule assembly Wzi family protein, partial [Synechococcus sp.]|nr:capsule assembly Wzi family protein [Synechococcus sp.]
FPLTGLTTGAITLYTRRQSEIDLPYRPSEKPIHRFFLSNSFVRMNLWKTSLGLSTENHWWGPGVRNSILMGHQAPGFRHAYVKTNAPISIGLGTIEGTYLGGLLEDTDINRSARKGEWVYISGVTGSFSPRFIPGLKLGLTRTFIINGSDLDTWSDYVPILQPFDKSKLGAGTDGGGSQPDDQRASVYFSWSMPHDAFRVYGEFAKEDHNANFRDILGEPEHNRAYQFGMQTKHPVMQGHIETGFEATHLTMSNSQQTRSSGYWYTHTKVKQGYTHQGQLLGAAIGPGSSSQTVWSTYDTPKGDIGILLERVAVNRDLYQDIAQYGLKPEIDLTMSLHASRVFGSLTASAAVDLTHTSNRYFRQGENRWLTSFRTSLMYSL